MQYLGHGIVISRREHRDKNNLVCRTQGFEKIINLCPAHDALKRELNLTAMSD